MYEGTNPTLEELEVAKKYDFSTQFVQGKLQEQINVIMQNAGDKTPMRIQLSSMELKDDVRKKGKGTAPFVLLLPDAARKKEDKNDEVKIDPIFDSEERREKVMLRPELYRLLSAYVFTKEDIHFISQHRNRVQLNISNNHYIFLRNYSNFKRIKSGDTHMIMVLLDPVKVFRSILIDRKKPNARFNLYIDKLVRVSGTNFIYTVAKEPYNSNKGEGMDEIMKKLTHCISGASGV